MSDFLSRISHFSPKRLALLADDLQRRVESLESAEREPIAIVGMGCRFPGGLNTPEQYWEFLCSGGDAITEVPAVRWNIDALYDADPDAPGKMSTRLGGFLQDVDQFDPHFFGIAPREAQRMDPQQRLLLEVSWEAIEHAGINADTLAETRASVFVGMSAGDYFQIMRDGGLESFDAYTASGSAHSIASGRLSYLLGLRGPSVAIDTACSSSLVAIHNAVQSLRRGESDMALAGGVNLILTPDVTVALSKAHMLAPDGHCKAFDASADGFVRGEGCGILVLKRLSDAVASGDRVVAVIRGIAANQDGRSNGLTAPNGPSQVAVLRDALKNAGLEPAQVDVVEAHGTGTSLGDPIEVNALATAFGAGRTDANPLWVGSVKANVGHLEAAAGVAGVIKMALALQHGMVPPQQHFTRPNPFIPWNELPIRVETTLRPWPAGRTNTRIGGVSSFGFSGTNVHALLEAYVPPPAPDTDVLAHSAMGSMPMQGFAVPRKSRPLHVLTVSARNETARAELMHRYRDVLRERKISYNDLAHSANTGRAGMSLRTAIVARNTADGILQLDHALTGKATDSVVRGATVSGVPRVAFLFTGQGAQYHGMAQAMYESDSAFRSALDECAEVLRSMLSVPLLEVLYADALNAAVLDDLSYAHAALFSVEYASARMWQHWGVAPTALLGHGVGEYAAACIAGVMSVEDALRLVTARARLVSALPRQGSMAAIFTDEGSVRAMIATRAAEVAIAAVNGPRHIVISGLASAVDAVLARAAQLDVRTTRLNSSHALHSPLMEAAATDFEHVAESITYRAPTIEICSNVSGAWFANDELSAAYWRRQLLNTVQFARGMQTLRDRGCTAFIEVGPHPTLIGMAQEFVAGDSLQWLPTFRRDASDWEQSLDSLARLYVNGANIDWRNFDADNGFVPQVLPTYPFQRSRYWVSTKATVANPVPHEAVLERADSASATGSESTPDRTQELHPLMPREVLQAATADRVFETRLSTARYGYLEDHRIFGTLLLPSPVLMEISRVVGSEVFGSPVALHDFTMHTGISVDDNREALLQAVVSEVHEGRSEIRIALFDDVSRRWSTRANVTCSALVPSQTRKDTNLLRSSITEEIDVSGYYDWLASVDLKFGQRFRAIERLWHAPDKAIARMSRPAALGAAAHQAGAHPAVLDACFHVLGAALPASDRSLNSPFLLSQVEHIEFHRALPANFWASVELSFSAARAIEMGVMQANMTLLSDDGAVLAELRGIQLIRAERASLPDAMPSNATAANVESVVAPSLVTSGVPEPATANESISKPVTPNDTGAGSTQLLHEILWVDQTDAQNVLPSPAEIRALVTPSITRIAAENNLAAYAPFSPALDDFAATQIVHAMRELGGASQSGATFTIAANPAELGVLPKHARLFARMIDILREDALVVREGSHLKVVNTAANTEVEVASLRQRHPGGIAALTLTHRAGSQLAGVLRGTVDPLSLLFPGGSLSEMEALYQSSPPARVYNELVGEAIGAIARRWNRNRPLRILEVGAGTGSTTSFVLPKLEGVPFEYTFSDVSPLFLNRAREKFMNADGMRYALLDIAGDMNAQGLTLAHFDVVIGANVMHATPDLLRTMRNVRELLAPDGVLVLLEGTSPQRFGDLTVGMLEGWWAFTDTARRKYALMPRAGWLSLLSEAGLSSPHVIVDDTAGPVLEEQAIFVARKPSDAVKASIAGHRYLVVPDATGLVSELETQLTEAGAHVTVIVSSSASELRTSLTSALRRADQARQPYDGVLHLGAIANTATTADANTVWRRQQRTLESALCTVQVMAAHAPGSSPLWFITRGAQSAANGESADCVQAAVWGLSHVVALEHPELKCRRVDLENSGDAIRTASQCVEALRAASDEDQIAVRGSRQLLRRLTRVKVANTDTQRFREDRTYLITGGTRGLGLLIAEWLVACGARHLVLMSRSIPTAAAQVSIGAMTVAGANVVIHTGDVANEADVQSVLAQIRNTPHALAGIVHSAGVLDDGVISSLDWNRFSTVMRPKVLGSWHLHRLAGALDFFVLFSSGASIAGSPGQANHAAANAFEDALAWHRQSLGMPTLSINWGPWATVGAAADRAVSGPSFLQLITPEAGLQTLASAMRRTSPNGLFERAQVAAFAADWSAVGQGASTQLDSPLFERLAVPASAQSLTSTPNTSTPAIPPRQNVLPALREQLRAAAMNRRRAVLLDGVRSLTLKVLGIASADGFDVQEPLRQLGLDSLMSVELRNTLGRACGTVFPATIAFEFPTVQALTDHIATSVFADEFESASHANAAPPSVQIVHESDDRQFDSMSDDEIAQRLASRLDALNTGDFK